ncbi:WhiB family transcriptional regulator [Phytoactinopolyspora alkaliphila]|uniref:Transcriptional regulator WhiB n=1 Tax=Phytoactinopolyspora alkaliphila TaxID=1783498 RepID=A0A6N9YQJ1_9ACTN|nr:WhiB family transcriptional regulator [Phytoactinopolyspora alkaliphila]
MDELHAMDWFGQQDSWRAFAACRGMDTDLFYPEGRGGTLRKREAIAKTVCESCPVAPQCRDAALQTPERFGIWGGLTEGERGWSRR